MSLFKSFEGLSRVIQNNISSQKLSLSITQIRTATKKVSGSKTNKNDSAGRRLGPKAYEGHYVQPGQIIMRQRGTKIHPGENVKLGVDHTIYAVEPGYVRFYFDPFHPLRKYVGVALKKDLNLPTPHFSPRIRRFGYELITDADKAIQEEDHKSRKEFFAQPEIERKHQQAEDLKQQIIHKNKESIKDLFSIKEEDIELVATRYYYVSQFVKNGQSLQDAKSQATFDYLYNLGLSVRRKELGAEEFEKTKDYFLGLVNELDVAVDVDSQGNLCKYFSTEERSTKQQEIVDNLKQNFVKVLSKQDRLDVAALIETPGVFFQLEQQELKERYLPKVLPITVPGSIIEGIDPENPPKGVVVQRIFDETSRSTKVVGRPKEVFN